MGYRMKTKPESMLVQRVPEKVEERVCEENALRALIQKNEEQNNFLNLTKQ